MTSELRIADDDDAAADDDDEGVAASSAANLTINGMVVHRPSFDDTR